MWVWWVFDELHRAWLGNGIFWVCQQRGRPLFIDPLLDSVRGGGLVALLRCAQIWMAYWRRHVIRPGSTRALPGRHPIPAGCGGCGSQAGRAGGWRWRKACEIIGPSRL